MALLDKLFYIKRKLDGKRESRDRGRSRQITPEHVRLLLFKDCDLRGRKLLFDSSTIEKVPCGKNDKANGKQNNEVPCVVEVSAGFSYVYKGPAPDASVLGEMIFGAVAINLKSMSLKIHIMNEPNRLMCTKVFCIPTSRRISKAERKTSDVNTSTNLQSGSKPLNVPLTKEEGVSLSFSIDRGDSGFYGADQSPLSSVSSTYDYFSMFDIWDETNAQDDSQLFHCPPGRKLSTSSNGSWQRRTFRNMATRFDLGSQSSNLLNVPTKTSNSSDSQLYTNSSASGTNDSLVSSQSLSQKKNKLGLALLITVADAAEMDLIRRCVEHCPQMQSIVCRLRLAALTAGSGPNFVATLHKAANDAATWLSDLMYGPRVPSTWLSLVSAKSQQFANKSAESLISDICFILSVGDTKNTNFFVSTLLTHVLTYHLGWVTTVSPYDTLDPQTLSLENVDSTKPYNALWAQLSDLCGSIGFPPRAARTIISGTRNIPFVDRLLLVLTYFLRCGDVTRSDYEFKDTEFIEKEVSINPKQGIMRKVSQVKKLEAISSDSLQVPVTNTQNSLSSVSTLVASEVSLKRSATLGNFSETLSNSSKNAQEGTSANLGKLRRNPTMMAPVTQLTGSNSSSSLSDVETEQKVVFVLGDDEKLVGLKNKSNGKKVKKSSKVHNEPLDLDADNREINAKEDACGEDKCKRSSESPSKCCGQSLQHSKPIKHSGFKFDFDKYPQIVTNYMKSKNLLILDRHYIGQPGNLKVDDFQFDPTVVTPIQDDRCEICDKCQLDSMLQTPQNASEMEFMNDIPRQLEPRYAKETIVTDKSSSETSPKTFVRKSLGNAVVVNVTKCDSVPDMLMEDSKEKLLSKCSQVKRVIEFPLAPLCARCQTDSNRTGFDTSLLGGVTDHYVPDLILQGTLSSPERWEGELCRDLDLTSYLNKSLDVPIQTVAVVGDTNKWEVSVLGRDCGSGGMSVLVAAMLEALPAMRQARIPAQQCLVYLESKLREFCVLSKTLADMLMTTDFCDINTLTKSLNIDVNDVPLLLAVATTHTPQVAKRYGISYR